MRQTTYGPMRDLSYKKDLKNYFCITLFVLHPLPPVQDNIYGQEVKLVAKVTKSDVDPETKEDAKTTVNVEKVEVLSKDDDEWCAKEAQKHLLNLKAYYRVASRRIMENVPMKIQYTMLRQLSVNIQNEVSGNDGMQRMKRITGCGDLKGCNSNDRKIRTFLQSCLDKLQLDSRAYYSVKNQKNLAKS